MIPGLSEFTWRMIFHVLVTVFIGIAIKLALGSPMRVGSWELVGGYIIGYYGCYRMFRAELKRVVKEK